MGPLLLLCVFLGAIAFFLSAPLKEAIKGRNQRKLLVLQHNHRIALLKQLNELASTELLAGELESGNAAELRKQIISQLDASLEAAVKAGTQDEPAAASRTRT